jgi:hypothetical protein
MVHSITLDSLGFPGFTDRSERSRQFVAESAAAPWAKLLRPGDRIETAGPGRETAAVVVKEVCVHPGGYAGLDGCLKHPNRDFDIRDSHLFETLSAAFTMLQTSPEGINSARASEMVVIVYTIERASTASRLAELPSPAWVPDR